MAKQNEKTLLFWDKFYSSEPTLHKEWILHPSQNIFHHLWELLSHSDNCSATNQSNPVQILEIGCGTSSMSRDFWKFCRDHKGSGQNHRDVSICATDVSGICVQQCRERDQELLHSPLSPEKSKLQYRVLNIAEPLDFSSGIGHNDSMPLKAESFDMILDKGCMDTFLFRSKHRGEQKDRLAQLVLNNIHSLLKKETGVYVIMTPRSKFFAVRDFPGFSKVERIPLEVKCDKVVKAELVEENAPKIKQNGKVKEDILYIYNCFKGERNTNTLPLAPTIANNVATPDDSVCPNCKMTFFDYRKGEDMEGRGAKFWIRRWKGHVLHCHGRGLPS